MKYLLVIFISLVSILKTTTSFSQEIFDAVRNTNVEQAISIIDADSNQLNAVLDGAYTPLSYATMLGREEIVSCLLAKGAEVNIEDKSIKTPLFYAVHRGHLNLVKLLVANGAHLDGTTMGMSLLHTSVVKNHLEITEYLLSQGMSINQQDIYGLTPLHHAVEFGILAMCELLLTKEADLNIRNNNGATPLHLADETGRQEISKFLISRGAKRVSRDYPVYEGKYLGFEYPGTRLELFGPNKVMRIIGAHSGVATSTDGREIFWARGDYSDQLWHMTVTNGVWTTPQRASFSSDFGNSYPCFSPDGARLFFSSDRPREKDGEWKPGVGDIWFVEKTESGWSDPVNAGDGVNTEGDEFIASVDMNNTLYFTRVVFQDGKVDAVLLSSTFENGKYQTAEPMDTTINTPRFDVGPFVSPDGSYLLFNSQRFGAMTTCISFRQNNGEWTTAKDIQYIFAPFTEPYVQGITGDGKSILFAGEKESSWDIYWISSEIIEKLKPKE